MTKLDQNLHELADLMWETQSTMEQSGWPEYALTFYYLPTEYHMLHQKMRGFGMEVSLWHKSEYPPTKHCLMAELRRLWGS